MFTFQLFVATNHMMLTYIYCNINLVFLAVINVAVKANFEAFNLWQTCRKHDAFLIAQSLFVFVTQLENLNKLKSWNSDHTLYSCFMFAQYDRRHTWRFLMPAISLDYLKERIKMRRFLLSVCLMCLIMKTWTRTRHQTHRFIF